MTRPLRIAMLSHSTNPRGGVVHAMQLSEALMALGNHVVLHAPDAKGAGFFRRPACGAIAFEVGAAHGDMTSMVEQRIADYIGYFETPAHRDFDVFHAHDGISGNVLATLKQRGLIPGFARTVHHIDSFDDRRLMQLQARSIDRADVFFTVSRLWQKTLWETHGVSATVVGNGVDTARFSSATVDNVAALRRKLAIPDGPLFLAIGGVEERKNTLRMLEAFRQVRAVCPLAQFVIAGGVSLLDHRGYQDEFRTTLTGLGDIASAVHTIGAVDDVDMPALYAMANTLVFASTKEGFGLVVLEAMASGVPVVTSSIAPFTEFLGQGDVAWCDPGNPASIAEAMLLSLAEPFRRELIFAGRKVAARHSWHQTAAAHLDAYAKLKESLHA